MSTDEEVCPVVEAYFAPPADEARLARKKMNRANRWEGTIKRITRLRPEEIEHWVAHCYPYETIQGRNSGISGVAKEKKQLRSVQQEVISSCGEYYAGKPISVKLLWYLHPEITRMLDEDEYALFSRLACSELGSLNVGRAKAEDYDQYICLDRQEGDASTGHQLAVLSRVLEFAMKHGHCYKNVLGDLAEIRIEEERDRLPEIRKALVKKSFTPLEMEKIYEFAVNQIEQEGAIEYLGVLIRLMTGLESNIVSGLCWDDFQMVTSYGFTQLLVCRQVVNNGTDYAGFAREYRYRTIPCPQALGHYLKKQRELVQSKYPGLTKERRGMLPLVTSMEILTKIEDRYRTFSPINLEKISKLAVKAAGIPDQIIVIPSQQKGSVETNLAHYQGDIFRSNFRFYGLQSARLEDGELCYLIGNKPETTFESHYFDYANHAEQYAMWVKLSGWCSGIFRRKSHYTERESLQTTSTKKIFQSNGVFSAGAEIYLKPTDRDVIEVEASSQCGMDCTILWEKSSEDEKVGD